MLRIRSSSTMESEPSNIWAEVKIAYERIEDLHFIQPLCVHNGQCCVTFPTYLYSLPCSCTICKNCWTNLRGLKGQCPLHRRNYWAEKLKGNSLTVQDVFRKKVHCPMLKYGCNFTGQLNDLKTHSDECCYMETWCPLECGEPVLKMNLPSHVSVSCVNRIVKCSKCGMEIAHSAKDKHEQNCKYSLQTCEMCSQPIASNEMEQHMEVCDHNIIPCKYSTLGCTYKDRKRNISDHENIDNHSDIFFTAINRVKQISDDVKEMKELLMKTPRGVVKESVDSMLGDIKQKSQISVENAITDLVSNITEIQENLPVTSQNSISFNESSSTNSDAIKPIRDEVIQQINVFLSDVSKKTEASLLEYCTSAEHKAMQILEQKMTAALVEEKMAVDPLVQCLTENFSILLQLMQKVCLQRSGNVIQNMTSNIEQKMEALECTLSTDSSVNPNIPEESTAANTSILIDIFKQISDSITKNFEWIAKTAFERTEEAISQTHQKILLSISSKFEQDLEIKMGEIISTNMKEVSSDSENILKEIIDRVLKNAQEEIAKHIASNMKTVTSSFESIVKKSSEELENKLKGYSDVILMAISSSPSSAENSMIGPGYKFTFGQ